MTTKLISLSVIVFAIIAFGQASHHLDQPNVLYYRSITDTPPYSRPITSSEQPVVSIPMNVGIVEWPHPLNLAGTINYSVTLNGEHVPMKQEHIESIVKAYNVHLLDATRHHPRVRLVSP